jgi:pimeloyl-ACP methyl ester carboxylesterase
MPYAVIQGLRLFYKDVGAGRPLVLVPGLGADSTAYNALLSNLRRRVRAIAPDPLGLGRSDDAPEPLTIQRVVEDLLALLDHLDVSKASLLGTSMGALVVRCFATLHPQRVDRLILCSPGGGRSPYARRIRCLLKALLKATPPEDFMGHFLTLMLSPAFINDHEGLLLDLEQASRPDERTLRTMMRQLAMMEAAAEEEIGVIRVPVLLIAGAQDRLAPLHHVQALHESLKGSRLLVLKEAAHHLFLEAPEEALRGLFAFLDEGE